jgi:hypothetical protein
MGDVEVAEASSRALWGATVTKQIIVQSANKARQFESTVPWACISIASEEDEWPEISETNRVGLLQLAFADSRSPAVAAAISRLYFGEDKLFFLPHLYEPNPVVYRILLETAIRRGDYPTSA